MALEILAIIAAAAGVPIGVILWRAGLNKLDERYQPKEDLDKKYMNKTAFTELKADIGNEMAEVRTSHQTLMGKWEVLDEKVTTLITDERHRDAKLERMEAQLTSVTTQLHKLEIDQLKGFSVLKDEIRVHVDGSIKRALEEIRQMVDRKI